MINFLSFYGLLVLCHLVGDYVLQNDFIAKTKGQNEYHLFVHCVLYCIPFAFVMPGGWQLASLFTTHVIIDSLKARYNKITYMQDQLLHYAVLFVVAISMV